MDARSPSDVAGIAVVALATGWLLPGFRTPPQPAMRVVPLTALSGSEYGGAFSPDGRQVAFCWNGEVSDGGTRPWWQGNWDIYIKAVGSSDLRRLTTDPGIDLAPEWSPDGRQIAYVRMDGPDGSPRIRVVSALGGSDRQVSDFPVFLPATWTPDSQYLVAARAGVAEPAGPSHGVYAIPIGGGAPRAITRARPSGQDLSAVLSADGHRLAYVACPGPGPDSDCHLQVVDVDAGFAAVGSPRRLTGPPLPGCDSSVSWTADGRFVIFNARDRQLSYLWRVEVDGGAAPERIERPASMRSGPTPPLLVIGWHSRVSPMTKTSTGSNPGDPLSQSRRRRSSTGCRSSRRTAGASPSARCDPATRWRSGSPTRMGPRPNS